MEKNDLKLYNEDDLRSKIYTIRGEKVMLDFELAEFYGYTTKTFYHILCKFARCFVHW